MRPRAFPRWRAALGASLALVAALSFSTTVLADSFSTTLASPTSVSTSPSSCTFGSPCAITGTGNQTTSIGGSGTYTNVEKFNGSVYPSNENWCVNLQSGSTLTLRFSSGSIAMSTVGAYCGKQVSSTQFSFSGPYTITGGTLPFDKVSGSGTVTGSYDVLTTQLTFSNISGTVDLGPVGGGLPPSGGGGGGLSIAATPELDSLLLLGTGLLGLAGYTTKRIRARGK